jgi:hypothetical protein
MLRMFLVECYWPGVDRAAVEAAAVRAGAAARALRVDGTPVEYVSALLVAGDDVVFHVYRAPDADAVRVASERADLPFERVVECVEVEDRSACVAPGGAGSVAPICAKVPHRSAEP